MSQPPTFRAYSSPQALEKAVRKVKKSLSTSPKKKQAVVEKLASHIGLLIPSTKPQEKNGLNQFNLIPAFSGSNDWQSIADYFATVEEIAGHFGWSNSIYLAVKLRLTGESNKDMEEVNRIEMLKSMLLANFAPEIRRRVIAANPKTLDEIKETAFLQERAWNSCRTTPSPFASSEASPSPIYAVLSSGRTGNQGVE
ncbi:hypothetical protein AVEN_48183-1 [Araneus ventricosus]|uniref:Uncharacterized protein n=1 Tax=Araneus ventricosus TaxID=182803 RepID=A0A4Y2J818_ARAVE|nr:hypothetical protein AVEN_48183-1 [Araneus ventricosus]